MNDAEINTLEDFERAVAAHDLTYSYSDDSRWWRAGEASYARIREAAKKFSREDVARIWNAAVDRKLVEAAREQFYWKETVPS